MKPANFLDSHEKFLIGVATKGGTETCLCQKDLYYQEKKFLVVLISNIKTNEFLTMHCWSFSGQAI